VVGYRYASGGELTIKAGAISSVRAETSRHSMWSLETHPRAVSYGLLASKNRKQRCGTGQRRLEEVRERLPGGRTHPDQ
jgi:hypothetical protein